MIKQEQHIIKGMLRDMSSSKFSTEFVFDAQNIRMTARDNNTLLSITNEKGNESVFIRDNKDNVIPIVGTVLGYNVLNKYLTIFSTDGNYDYIYRLNKLDDGNFKALILFKGNLGFDTNHPIETLGSYENDNILKVYWVDGINQARVINLMADPIELNYDNNSFNLVLDLKLKETIAITKNSSGNGTFNSGVIQYAFSYFNLYGQESNIFYTSPLYYISFDNRGGSPEEKVSNSFSIRVADADGRFDYLRIYSIYRTSIDAVPTVSKVADLQIPKSLDKATAKVTFPEGSVTETNTFVLYGDSAEDIYLVKLDGSISTLLSYYYRESANGNPVYRINLEYDQYILNKNGGMCILRSIAENYQIERTQTTGTNKYAFTGMNPFEGNRAFDASLSIVYEPADIVYIDNGTNNETIDPTELLYIGGEAVVPGALAHKDNTLFLGNIKLDRNIVEKDLRDLIRNLPVLFHTNIVRGCYENPSGYYFYKSLLDDSEYLKGFKYLEWYRFGVLFQHKSGKWSEPVYIGDYQNTVHPILKNKTYRTARATVKLTEEIINKAKASDFIRARGVVVFPDNSSREVIAQGILCPTVYNVEDRYSNSPFVQSSWFIRPSLGKVDDGSADITSGSWAEFRHNYPIPDNWKRNAEIQCLANVPSNPYGNLSLNWVQEHKEYYFVDQSVLTFHSPDIEFDDTLSHLDMSDVKLRIVGKVQYTSNIGDLDIQTSTPPFNSTLMGPRGVYKVPIGVKNISVLGVRSLMSVPCYVDGLKTTENISISGGIPAYMYMVYPWNASGSLNNEGTPEEELTPSALLSNKKMSNLKYASYTVYMDSPWNAYILGDENHTGISGVQVFNSDTLSLLRLNAPENSTIANLNYYGNVDKVVACSRRDEGFSVDTHAGDSIELNTKYGFPISATYIGAVSESFPASPIFGFLNLVKPLGPLFDGKVVQYRNDPVSIKYKSGIHAVLALNYTSLGKQVVLPTTSLNSTTLYPVENEYNTFWDPDCKGVYQDVITEFANELFGYSWLAELYREVDNTTRFGGNTEEVLENNIWIPAGEPVYINYNISSADVDFIYGDTYFQRYDCLKTYPYTMEDINSVVEIASFVCETRVNIDGRYDKNRGQTSNLVMTPLNFNLMNNVYSQKNTFFKYRGLNYNKYTSSLDYFPNTITWTKEKQAGAIVDSWTNITMASTLDLDGDKGEITSLNTFNNEIYCFLKQGFSNILFNSRVLIPTSDDVPIEITNGLKVGGKRYISNTIGCNNKWSIVESPNGIYFIDNITNSIYLFNGLISSLSDKLGFRQWIGENNSLENWNPVNFKNFVSFYDKNNDDVYFVNDRTALVYSELLGLFTSFMSYDNVPAMFNVENDFYAIKDGLLWHQFEGEYNSFFGVTKPYSITIISNSEEPYDKIFNTLEFRADSWDNDTLLNNKTFDTLDVWNEYLHGTESLINTVAKPSTLKKKFRVWRVNIPRDNSNKRDRIRNTWAYIKLSMNTPNTWRTELHDMIVHYFI